MREPCAMTSQVTIIAYPERKDVRLFCPAHPADGFSSFSQQFPRPTRVAGKRVLKAAATWPERPAELRDRSLRSL